MRSLGSDNKKICNVPSECRYNDGNYTVRAKGYDIRGNLRTSQLNSEEEMVLDNFMPYVKSVDVFVDACQIYKLERTEISSTSQNNAKLKQNTANFIKRLDPNGEDINFTITVSEPMEELKLRYEVNGVPAIQTLIGTANNMTWTGSINGISSLDDLTVSMFGKDRAGNRLLNVAASTMNVKESTITLAYRKQRDSGSPSNDWVNYNSVLFDSPTTLEEFDHIILNFGPNECSAGLKGDNEDTNLRSICGDPDCEILLEVNQHACGYSVDLGFDNPNSLYTIKWTDENGNEIKELEGLTRFEAEENGLYCFEITLGLDCCSTEGCVRVNVLIPPIYFRDDNTLNDGFTTTTLDLFDFISLAECIKVDIIRSSDRILIHSCTDPSRIELDLEIGEEYCMKISDCNDASCFYTHCFTVEGETCPGIIDINQRQLVPSCNTENTGTISIDAQSNCNPVSIKWSNGDTGNTISELSAGTYCATVTVGDPECNDITGLSCKAVKCFKVRERTCDCEDNPGMPSITQRQVCRWVYPEFGDPFIVWTVQVIVDVSDRGYCITLDGMNPTSSLFDYTRERIIYTFDTGGELCYTIVDKCTLFEYSDCIDLVIDPERPCYIYPPDIPIEVTDRFTTNDPDVINFTTINEIESYTHKFELISTIDSTPIELDRSEYMFGNELYDSEILPKKIELNTSEDFEIKAFPNPFSDLLTVEIFIQNEPTDVELNVSSIDGKNMISLKRKSIAGKTNIELPEAYELKSGLYYLSIIVNDKVRTIPIVKI